MMHPPVGQGFPHPMAQPALQLMQQQAIPQQMQQQMQQQVPLMQPIPGHQSPQLVQEQQVTSSSPS